MDEIVVFLMREFGWTLEYATNLAKKLPLKKLNVLIDETKYQKSVDEYNLAANFALIISVWLNSQTKGRKYKITDFIGQYPQRKGQENILEKAAKKEGIILP